MAESDPEVMRAAPMYRGTRIPVQAITHMLRKERRWRRFWMAKIRGEDYALVTSRAIAYRQAVFW
jgi:hypothetical protein